MGRMIDENEAVQWAVEWVGMGRMIHRNETGGIAWNEPLHTITRVIVTRVRVA